MKDDADVPDDGPPQKLYSWRSGIPVRPDVDLMLKTWPDLQVGDRITYGEVASVIGVSATGNRSRWDAVTGSWRKRLLNDYSLVVECQTGAAFYVASAKQVIAETTKDCESAQRKFRLRRRKLGSVRAENDEDRAEINHQGMILHALEQSIKKNRMNLIPSCRMPDVPQVGPPAKVDDKAR